jgi:hypothetical protein
MPSQRLIVYTRPDGGVSVCAPSLTALRYMTNGGGRWDDILLADREFLDRQIDAQAANGVGERAARRFVHAMQFGGCTEAEAYEIMRDRYCAPHGSAFELVDGVSHDRWFRNAWRRSHNGGPIGIDMVVARKIQLAKLQNFSQQRHLDLRWPRWRQLVRAADTPERLKQIWPRHPA